MSDDARAKVDPPPALAEGGGRRPIKADKLQSAALVTFARADFWCFVELMFPVLYPGQKLVYAGYLELIATLLMRVGQHSAQAAPRRAREPRRRPKPSTACRAPPRGWGAGGRAATVAGQRAVPLRAAAEVERRAPRPPAAESAVERRAVAGRRARRRFPRSKRLRDPPRLSTCGRAGDRRRGRCCAALHIGAETRDLKLQRPDPPPVSERDEESDRPQEEQGDADDPEKNDPRNSSWKT